MPSPRELTLTRRLSASPTALWPLLGDTNRLDRAAGMARASYRFEQRGDRRVRVGEATELGVTVHWVEEPYEWVEGRFVAGERHFLDGPAERGGLRIEIRPDGEGSEVTARWHFVPRGLPGRVIGRVMEGRFRQGLGRFFDGLEAAVRSDALGTLGSVDPTPGVEALAQPDTFLGPRATVDGEELRRRVGRLHREKLSPEVVSRLERLIAEGPDEAVGQMRPFALARTWGAPRRDALRGFLHATRAGLVDLRWQVDCPVCRVSAGVHERLSDVRSSVHCDACGVDYGVGFGEHVEAVFQVNPAIRRAQTAVFCASTPSFRRHVFAQLACEAGSTREEPASLPRGDVQVRIFGEPEVTAVQVPAESGRLEVAVRENGLEVRFVADPGAELDALELENELDGPVLLQFERADWNADAALGSAVATFPDFRDLFATEAPAAGVDLSIGHLALLFTDLVGSTALYGRVGDARAYALVQEHFDLMAAVIGEHEGAVVKTMGDAVMASFAAPADAVAAALEMVRRHDERFAEDELGLKVGVHAGPCLAVQANGQLDYFGTTVNMAARLQGKAGAGELVMTRGAAEDPPVADLIGGCDREVFTAPLKGIDPVPELVRVHLDRR